MMSGPWPGVLTKERDFFHDSGDCVSSLGFFVACETQRLSSIEYLSIMTEDQDTAVVYNEQDLALRLVEAWYDSVWAYFMEKSVDKITKRLEKQSRKVSSTASVTSATSNATTSSILGKSVQEKMHSLVDNLEHVKEHLSAREFHNICAVCLKHADSLYPGFRDILHITHYLLKECEPYRGQLTSREIEALRLPTIFQHLFYQLCSYLLRRREILKLIVMPTKITHATYDICRQKYCRVLCEEVSVVQYGLYRLIKTIQAQRPSVSEEEPKPKPVKKTKKVRVSETKDTPTEEPPAPAAAVPDAPKADPTPPGSISTANSERTVPEVPEVKPKAKTTNKRSAIRRRKPTPPPPPANDSISESSEEEDFPDMPASGQRKRASLYRPFPDVMTTTKDESMSEESDITDLTDEDGLGSGTDSDEEDGEDVSFDDEVASDDATDDTDGSEEDD